MNVSLTPKLEEMVRGKVESGLYNNASEVVREALRLLSDRDRETKWLIREAAIGYAQMEAGETTPVGTKQQLREIARGSDDLPRHLPPEIEG